jgi:DNA-binding transcriptional regulator YiaG
MVAGWSTSSTQPTGPGPSAAEMGAATSFDTPRRVLPEYSYPWSAILSHGALKITVHKPRLPSALDLAGFSTNAVLKCDGTLLNVTSAQAAALYEELLRDNWHSIENETMRAVNLCYKRAWSSKMDDHEAFPRYEHTCSFEERRFGTCDCRRRASNQAPAVAYVPTEQPVHQPDLLPWVQALKDERTARFRAELTAHLRLMALGERIRLLRSVLGWTQQQAATELGISRRTVMRYEQAQRSPERPHALLSMRLQQVESENEAGLTNYLLRHGR